MIGLKPFMGDVKFASYEADEDLVRIDNTVVTLATIGAGLFLVLLLGTWLATGEDVVCAATRHRRDVGHLVVGT